jgi:hypothetical protein
MAPVGQAATQSLHSDEVAELGVDHVAMDAHPSEARLHGDRLMRNDPDLAGEPAHLHRKSHRGIHGPDPALLQRRDDRATHVVHVITGAMKFDVGHRPRGAANRLPIHAADDSDERFDVGVDGENIFAIFRQCGPIEFDEADIVRTGFKAELA